MKLQFKNFPQALQIVVLDGNQKPLTEYEKDERVYLAGNYGDKYSIQIINPNIGQAPEKRIFVALKADSIEVLKGTQKSVRSAAGQGYTFLNQHFTDNTLSINGWSMNGDVTTPFEFTQSDDFLEGVMFKQMQGKLFEQGYQKIEGTIYVENLAWGADEDPEIAFEHGDSEQQSFVLYYKSQQELIAENIMVTEETSEILALADKSVDSPRKAKNIYALIVAINDYPVPHHKLKGCINDATSMIEYLYTVYNTADTAIHIKRLFNEQATHQNISSDFLNHLGKAQGSDDIALFYFCGHGSQEPCPAEFLHEEPTKMNSGTVCHDSRDPDRPGRYDLADKEIRYLIWKLEQKTKANVVVIQDCCHSGGGTREVDSAETPVLTRKIENSDKTRPIDTFCFFNDPDFESWKTPKGDIFLPSGRHIQMAAAHSTQTAKETVCEGTPHGIFTHSLLSILYESGSGFTYNDLKNRIKTRIANKVKDQTPEIAAVVDQNLMDTVFLGTAVLNRSNIFTASYNEQLKFWVVDSGSAYGIPAKAPNVLFGLYKNPDDLSKNKMVGMGKVTAVRPDMCRIDLVDMTETAKPGDEFYAKVVFMDKPKIPIFFDRDPNDAATSDAVWELYQKRVQNSQNKEKWNSDEGVEFLEYVFVDKPNEAEFRLVVENQRYYIKRVGVTKPIVKSTADPEFALGNVAQIAKWINNKELNNPTTSLPKDEISFEINTVDFDDFSGSVIEKQKFAFYPEKASEVYVNDDFGGGWTEADDSTKENFFKQNGDLRLEYTLDENTGEWKAPQILFRVNKEKNPQNPFYFFLLHFDPRFGTSYVSFDTSDSTAKYLVLNESCSDYASADPIILDVADVLWKHGITELNATFKLFYSSMPIEPGPYLLKSLELPDDEDMQKATRANLKPLRPQPDWACLDVHVSYVRPKEAFEVVGQVEIAENVKVKTKIPMRLMLSSTKSAEESMAMSATSKSNPQDIIREQGAKAFGMDGDEDNALNVLELIDANPHELNSQLKDNPIQLDLTGKIGKGETVMTMIPCEDGLVLPMFAEEDENGNVVMNITQVPTEISPAGSRSLGGSLKMMMQKMVSEAIGSKFNAYPIMALAEVSPDGSKMEYKGKSRRECLELIQQEINNEKSQNCILFIHGITGDTKDMPQALNLAKSKVSAAYKEVSNLYDVVMTFDYENLNTTIEENAEHLKNTLKEAGFFKVENGKMVKNPYKTLHIVAHSMGGLVARWFIEQLDGDQVADHLIMFGTPNGGSPWSKAKDMVMMALTLVLSKVSLAAWAVAPLTFLVKKVADEGIKSLKQMNPNSDFYKAINNEKLNRPQIPYTIVAGNTAKVANPDEMASTMQKAAKKLNMVLENWLFTEPHDIAVSVEYIKIKNVWEKMGRNIKEYPVNAELPADISTTEETVVIMEAACDHMSYFVDPAGLKAFSEVLLKRVNPKN